MNERKSTKDLIATLRTIVGRRHCLTRANATHRYRTGYRSGEGPALAVVRPGTLVEQWRVVQACVAADTIIIMQASNTGLTGGSTPDGDGYDRPVVIVSTRRLSGIHVLAGGRQVVCLPGSTLSALERVLAPLGREPHSVIGSSCIGASVIGGICNNSGGSLVQRGPAFTQLALFARIGTDGQVDLVNHLGIGLGSSPEEMLDRLERGDWSDADIAERPTALASDRSYADYVRAVDECTPARFNADPGWLFEASGSAGKLVLFAVRLDSFPADAATAVFYIGSNDPKDLAVLRRTMLAGGGALPVAAEYIHRTAFDIADDYGRDTVLAIRWLGVSRLPLLFTAKARMDAAATRLGLRGGLSDRLLQRVGRLFPSQVPPRMRDWRDRYAHHLVLKMAGPGIGQARAMLAAGNADWFECTVEEGARAFLHRFAVAGAAVRYRAVHADEVEDIVALDIALPRNCTEWTETLPTEIDLTVRHKLYYGHFFCHVFHQDYVIAKGHDPHAIKQALLVLLDHRGAEYPAEHGVGHLYAAKPALAGFFRDLDPTNSLNPGVGRTSKCRHWT